MRTQLRSIIREAVERIPSEGAYVAAMRRLSRVGGGRLRIERRDGLVVLNGVHYLPSVRRLPFYLRGLEYRAKKLAGEYLLERISLADGDVVIDCGANVGDLLMSLDATGARVQYIAFEPGLAEFRCLQLNAQRFTQHQPKAFQQALSNRNGKATLYVNSDAADNSMLEIAGASCTVHGIDAVRLDSVIAEPRVKLLKLEAEGFEPEILEGAEGILDRIEYITADVGFERGVAHESTLPAVTNFLLARGFQVVGNGKDRLVLLFKNTALRPA